MAILGDVELLVTPEQLNNKAAEVEKNVANMRTRFDNMKRLIDKSQNYWIGDAGDMHRQNYADQVENIELVLKRLAEHPEDLRAIAQTYSETELKIADVIVPELPGDVL
jgi:WXG100 family type VII secretion target